MYVQCVCVCVCVCVGVGVGVGGCVGGWVEAQPAYNLDIGEVCVCVQDRSMSTRLQHEYN